MPNTLIHIAVQVPLSRSLFKTSDLSWIIAGTIIPDIPWIFQRIFITTGFFDPYDLRLYCTAQASLLFCLFLCGAISSLTKKPGAVFSILALNSCLHLLLDALQIKWANGVHLFIPFSWNSLSFELLWPEHVIGYLLSALGIVTLCFFLLRMKTLRVQLNTNPRWSLSIIALLMYLVLPFTVMNQLEKHNPSHVKTLRETSSRAGKTLELDRSFFSANEQTVTTFTRETLSVSGIIPKDSGIYSMKGFFTAADHLQIQQYHKHTNYRDYATIIGLSLSLLLWFCLVAEQMYTFIRRNKNA